MRRRIEDAKGEKREFKDDDQDAVASRRRLEDKKGEKREFEGLDGDGGS